jgi:hypothetical protein
MRVGQDRSKIYVGTVLLNSLSKELRRNMFNIMKGNEEGGFRYRIRKRKRKRRQRKKKKSKRGKTEEEQERKRKRRWTKSWKGENRKEEE